MRKPMPWALEFSKRSFGKFRPETKRQVIDTIRKINRSSPIGRILRGRQHLLYQTLITFHPEIGEKLAAGCVGFAIRQNSRNGSLSRGPHVVAPSTALDRTDEYVLPTGITVPFSHNRCFGKVEQGPQPRDAARSAIESSIRNFRRSAFSGRDLVPCAMRVSPECRRDVSRRLSHVDHAPPWTFLALFEAWVNTIAIEPTTIERYRFDEEGVCHFVVEFGDTSLSEDFRSFHEERVVLRIACDRCNLGRGVLREAG